MKTILIAATITGILGAIVMIYVSYRAAESLDYERGF